MSTSPSPKSSWSRRMGTAVRRASSVFDLRPSTPSIGSESLEQINTSPAESIQDSPLRPLSPLALSPIAESPAREAAASLEDHAHIGPSPLAQSTMHVDAHDTLTLTDAYTETSGSVGSSPLTVPWLRPSGSGSVAATDSARFSTRSLSPLVGTSSGISATSIPSQASLGSPILNSSSIREEPNFGFDLSSRDVSHSQPPAYPDSPPKGIPMDCGMMPSQLYPPGQRPSRRRVSPSQGPEQAKASGGDGRIQAEWVVPFSRDSRQSSTYWQRNPGEPSDKAYAVACDFETREVSPHSSPSPNPSNYHSHLHSPANPYSASSTKPLLLQEGRPFSAHGWVEYLLPDESFYYVHQGYQVVADMDLNDEKLLDAVMAYLEGCGDVILPGKELWLQDPGFRGGRFDPLRWLVDHSRQLVVFDSLHEANCSGEGHHIHYKCEDDRLDAKYRYWSFMEAHPAHTSLPLSAHQDAIDAIDWASTNGLIHSYPSRSAPASFTQEECQSFAALLQSLGKRGETPLLTHTVSKILLRVVCWRQSHFRPDKPLPTDAGRNCLRWEDHPITPVCGSTSTLTTGVCACLMAAIALGSSRNFARIAGIGAILFSVSPRLPNVVTAAQSKADHEAIVPHGMSVSSLKSDHTAVDLQPPTPPPTHTWLWEGLESWLRGILLSGPPDVVPIAI
ncbi:hypothetical protein BD779DRAFT_1672967 [Infundibulicybe gibba]|nr:hypothetical protein BD779DRAFT_1672967 [Infundibulicybe gibba]